MGDTKFTKENGSKATEDPLRETYMVIWQGQIPFLRKPMKKLILTLMLVMPPVLFAQAPPIGPGVSLELAKWRAARYSDVRYKLNLTLEKMSPVLKGTMEVRVKLSEPPALAGGFRPSAGDEPTPIILDWRRIKGHEEKSTISNVRVNGKPVVMDGSGGGSVVKNPPANAGGSDFNEHLIFRDGVVVGEYVITLDFTSPILTSGSAITRYVDKEDGSEYIYSLFVPSDASTAFPVFDQPDLKARFSLEMEFPADWSTIANSPVRNKPICEPPCFDQRTIDLLPSKRAWRAFDETKTISTYIFAFAAGPFARFPSGLDGGYIDLDKLEKEGAFSHSTQKVVENSKPSAGTPPTGRVSASGPDGSIYVRKSQSAKFKPHAAEVFRLNHEAVKYFEQYFDYKFPFPKYDLVLIPEFPFGGMEHAGATFLRESAIIFPQEPTKNDLVSRATLIFHEAAHQWFGDTVTMRWFDDLWLKEGFATFTAYKAMEKIMPEMNAWKVFYERIKQGAYQTDSTRGTTAIYQPIANLSAAKSAYGNIVYNKAPAFLRQAEFYLGEDKFQTAVRAFLKKHEFGNAGWEDLVREFERSSGQDLREWAKQWVTQPGLLILRTEVTTRKRSEDGVKITPTAPFSSGEVWKMKWYGLMIGTFHSFGPTLLTAETKDGKQQPIRVSENIGETGKLQLFVPNYGDYGYGIFLLDEKSRDYVIKNIQNEKDPFLRAMMWGALWDSVREGELDPREYVELVIKNFPTENDETISSSILGRATIALNYYVADKTRDELVPKFENGLIDRLTRAEILGHRITIYRAFLNVAATVNGQDVLRAMLKASLEPQGNVGPKPFAPGLYSSEDVERILRFEEMLRKLPLKTKDKFEIVTRLLILGDPKAPGMLAELEKTETGDDAKRYAYAARAGIATAENKAKYWNDFVNNKEISESWIEAAFGPWNSIRHSELTLPYLERALRELPNHKRSRKIFFVNGWLGAFIGGQRSPEALAVVNKFLADNPRLDNDLRLKILENVDLIERAVNIRRKFPQV